MGSNFASDDGRLKPGIDGLTVAQHAYASRGDFVHIEMVSLWKLSIAVPTSGSDACMACLRGSAKPGRGPSLCSSQRRPPDRFRLAATTAVLR